ncbi:cytochrome c1 heme precursor [Pyrenophora seminiperda CCB06]|uniref:Cytochrome c1 heme n=1 Tax=Pyrenophora seminiperda CCB06 TaxID=1302712 RepID=A0A3M7LXQ7_9PLEO|nr:cytochrome c1 heme precursor [Pyrenophora seminiperda CCB06]
MVYITSDLFGPSTTNDWQHNTAPNYWHTMAQEQHAAGLGKRKRLATEDAPPTNMFRQHRSSPSRDATRLQRPNTPSFDSNSSFSYAPSRPKSCDYLSDRRPVKQLKRISPKSPLVKSTSHLMDIDLDTPAPCQPSSSAVSDLRSCHACNKAPKRRKDLENYLDCRRCQERTCFICARQCVGCAKSICKKCIVEVGEEGDAWCLDCYAHTLNT